MMTKLPDPLSMRKTEYPVNDIFLKRWSPRALSGEKVSADQINSLIEAARWAPSTYNEQEWRFLYASKNSPHWDAFFGLLMEANQEWCKNASHLIAVIARQTFSKNNKPNPVASLDCGAAMQNLLLQAADMGLAGHPMAGFHSDQAPSVLQIPEGFAIQAMIAIGKQASLDSVPAEVAEGEVPTDRKAISEIAREGLFSFEQ